MTEATTADAVIGCRHVAKQFGHVRALRDATVTVPAGKVVALVGDNGAGKSTLLRTLLGLERPDSGEVIIAGRPVALHSVRDAQALGVDAVHQDLALAPDLSVVDNVFPGHEDVGGRMGRSFGVLARRRMSERAAVALRDLSIRLPSLSVPVRDLSGGQRQAVAFNATSTNTIANNFQSAALTKPQGVFTDPFDNNQFIAQYKTMMASGVPVVTGNGTTPPAEYKYIYSAADTARFAPEVLKGVPSGAGSLVYLGGAPGIPPLQSRTLPFVKAVETSRPGLKVLPTEYSGFDVNKATTDLGSILLANPDLKLVIAADGPDAQGAVSAIKAAGKAGKVTLVAFDAIPTEVAALKEGVITDLIAQSPFQIGRDSVKAIVDYLKAHTGGGAVANAGTETVPNQLLTKANVDSPANAGYIYKASC